MFKKLSFRSRLILGALVIFLISGTVWLLVGQYYLSKLQKEGQAQEITFRSYLYLLHGRIEQKDWLLNDLTKDAFFQGKETPNLKDYKKNFSEFNKDLSLLLKVKKIDSFVEKVNHIKEWSESYNKKMNLLVEKCRTLGFQNWGLVGIWKKNGMALEKSFMGLKDKELLLELLQLRRDEKNFLLREDKEHFEQVQTRLISLKKKVSSLSPEKRGDSLEALQDYEEAFKKYKNLLTEIGGDEYAGLRGELSQIMDNIKKEKEKLLQESQQNSRDALSALTLSRIAILFITFLLAAVLFYLLGTTLSRPILHLRDRVQEVTRGDLSVEIEIKSEDEVGQLSHSFNDMVRSIRTSTEKITEQNNTLLSQAEEISQGVQVLSSSVAQIASTISQVSASASETASAVSETASTVEEVKQTAHTSSQRASYVADLSQKAVDISVRGKAAVEKTTLGMSEIQEQMESIGACILKLSEQSQSIGEIIATVKDLAEQSNLLAVNASIEAAKAGEQGRGFAVVAQEIKLLADQSKEATAHVRNILNDIQKATNSAVLSTEQGNKAVKAGAEKALESGEALDSLAKAVQEASQAAFVILSSSKEQMVGMEQISTAIGNVKEASAQNQETMGQLKEASQNLNKLGGKLKGLIEKPE